jgi:hypothetical protein
MQKCLLNLIKQRHKSTAGNISDVNFIFLNQLLFYGIPCTGQ